jgi:acyl-[acyl-carrier-protein]-phospholipid O-acyltransferase/long-chain-fatty-acid--[acyl-carrier-protein] ligase
MIAFTEAVWSRRRPEDFATLTAVLTGGERLTPELARAFEERFGVRPYEGYGATELSPLVSYNVPPDRTVASDQSLAREGTVGRPLPGVSAKVADPDTFHDDVPAGQRGLLMIKGPNVMRGYLDQPELTADVIHNG